MSGPPPKTPYGKDITGWARTLGLEFAQGTPPEEVERLLNRLFANAEARHAEDASKIIKFPDQMIAAPAVPAPKVPAQVKRVNGPVIFRVVEP